VAGCYSWSCENLGGVGGRVVGSVGRVSEITARQARSTGSPAAAAEERNTMNGWSVGPTAQ
jgi:hypothetical protein